MPIEVQQLIGYHRTPGVTDYLDIKKAPTILKYIRVYDKYSVLEVCRNARGAILDFHKRSGIFEHIQSYHNSAFFAIQIVRSNNHHALKQLNEHVGLINLGLLSLWDYISSLGGGMYEHPKKPFLEVLKIILSTGVRITCLGLLIQQTFKAKDKETLEYLLSLGYTVEDIAKHYYEYPRNNLDLDFHKYLISLGVLDHLNILDEIKKDIIESLELTSVSS